MFLSRNEQNNVYPCKPQFSCIKVGFKGVKVIYVFVMTIEAVSDQKIMNTAKLLRFVDFTRFEGSTLVNSKH